MKQKRWFTVLVAVAAWCALPNCASAQETREADVKKAALLELGWHLRVANPAWEIVFADDIPQKTQATIKTEFERAHNDLATFLGGFNRYIYMLYTTDKYSQPIFDRLQEVRFQRGSSVAELNLGSNCLTGSSNHDDPSKPDPWQLCIVPYAFFQNPHGSAEPGKEILWQIYTGWAHEYTHVSQSRATLEKFFGDELPQWYVEGGASLIASLWWMEYYKTIPEWQDYDKAYFSSDNNCITRDYKPFRKRYRAEVTSKPDYILEWSSNGRSCLVSPDRPVWGEDAGTGLPCIKIDQTGGSGFIGFNRWRECGGPYKFVLTCSDETLLDGSGSVEFIDFPNISLVNAVSRELIVDVPGSRESGKFPVPPAGGDVTSNNDTLKIDYFRVYQGEYTSALAKRFNAEVVLDPGDETYERRGSKETQMLAVAYLASLSSYQTVYVDFLRDTYDLGWENSFEKHFGMTKQEFYDKFNAFLLSGDVNDDPPPGMFPEGHPSKYIDTAKMNRDYSLP